MEGNRWQALQSHLKTARTALQDGDRTRALDEVNAALSIDPEFAAALALRDRIIATDSDDSTDPAAPPPLVSTEGYARFEERTRQRRIDRRADAAIAAIAGRRFAEAGAAIEEIRELDRENDGLPALQALLERERLAGDRRAPLPPRSTFSRGPQFAAAAVFAAVMLAAPRLQPSRLLASRPMSVMASLVANVQPAPMLSAGAPEEPATPTAPTSTIATAGTTGSETPSPLPAATFQPVTAAPPPEAPPSAPEPEVGDSELIRQALQRYRLAYERPDDLESQHLTFDSCDVQVHGESAAAACRGTTRHVTKDGRDPLTESRVWNFTLRKDGTGWKIETARAER